MKIVKGTRSASVCALLTFILWHDTTTTTMRWDEVALESRRLDNFEHCKSFFSLPAQTRFRSAWIMNQNSAENGMIRKEFALLLFASSRLRRIAKSKKSRVLNTWGLNNWRIKFYRRIIRGFKWQFFFVSARDLFISSAFARFFTIGRKKFARRKIMNRNFFVILAALMAFWMISPGAEIDFNGAIVKGSS